MQTDFYPFFVDNSPFLLDIVSGKIIYNYEGIDLISYFNERMLPEEKKVKPKVKSFSLSVAQKCNLGCTYCYAEQGNFGSKPDNMKLQAALQSVDQLFSDAVNGEHYTLAFMGGEPLFNREVLYKATKYAFNKAKEKEISLGFTITTNATLIRLEDLHFFHRYQFTVTVSIDGVGEVHDQLRPYISGKSSFNKVKEKVLSLVNYPNRNYKVFARATVTTKNTEVLKTLQELQKLGFHSIQFSPMLNSPNGKEQLSEEEIDNLLIEFKKCGDYFEESFQNKKLIPFQNVLSILSQIHNYKKQSYPCGAGGSYMSVSASGELYACHRFVNDENGYMGDIQNGIDASKQEDWLISKHSDNQVDCQSCWARNLCAGSCHHEVMYRGRPACNYIRGWIDYCLKLYVRLYQQDATALEYLLGNNMQS
ncbi:SPASM domain-containing protein [Chryseobacterium sp. Ch-15]|uniref:SPASM domain-containing protein n=1 Tax=Chryseobacterium muglaense TaxID=2893752 RepID=A0A9Q3YRQ0_9FLAO|nr:radical SAM protein [Chryseobacterium muglaense]MCC9033022.1 SPASM domain-containing protein [Chryseobacterium muglaense]MCC9033153.1 SPASM domain-containing protein [Chryseobacterium muglaense]MCM2557051.1 SPASM domain-containing protein [Chryseobacterium muglaense]